MNLIHSVWNNRPGGKNRIDDEFITKYGKKKMALGGTIDDLDENELSQIQQFADENGISIEEALEMANQQGGEEEGGYGEQEFATGGRAGMKIKLNPAHKGWCTPMTKSTCTGKRRQFAINAKKWKHAMGGTAGGVPIEVEHDEVLQMPNGKLHQMKGRTHESGGIDIDVPKGTKIYSDRVKIDGKTMQERKLSREKSLARLEKLSKESPVNKLIKIVIKELKKY